MQRLCWPPSPLFAGYEIVQKVSLPLCQNEPSQCHWYALKHNLWLWFVQQPPKSSLRRLNNVPTLSAKWLMPIRLILQAIGVWFQTVFFYDYLEMFSAVFFVHPIAQVFLSIKPVVGGSNPIGSITFYLFYFLYF